jgi:hypothetical protein
MPFAVFKHICEWDALCTRGIGSICLGVASLVEGGVMLGAGDDAICFPSTDWTVSRLDGDDILLTPKSEMRKGKPGKKQLVPSITDKRTADGVWFHLGAGLNTTPADILYGILMSNQRKVRGAVESVLKHRGDTFFEEYPLIMHIVVSAFPYIIKLLPLTIESFTAVMTPSIFDLRSSSNLKIIKELHQRLSAVVCKRDIISMIINSMIKIKLFYILIEELVPQYNHCKRITLIPLQYEVHEHNTINVNAYTRNGGVFPVSDLSLGDDIRKKLIVQYPTFLERNEIPTDSPSPEEAFNIHCISSAKVCNHVGWAMYLYGLITKPKPYRESEGGLIKVHINFN